MIDLHCHILPGIDDGPPTIEDSLELARAFVAAGTRTVVATSHVSPRYPNDARTIGRLVDELSARLRAEEIPLAVRPGGEVAIPMVGDIPPAGLEALRLGGGPWLLVESPFAPVIDALPTLLGALQGAGHRIVLAHPERCPGFHRRPDILRALVCDQGVITSVTAGSLDGQFGREVERFALGMARDGLLHCVASDAHDCIRRPPDLVAPLERAGLGPHLELLVDAVPRAILDGLDLPEHPGALLDPEPRRRRWWPQRRRSG